MKINNKAMSAAIGVILMVAITVAIAATVYIYVKGTIEENNIYEDISGNVTKIEQIYSHGNIDYRITFDYNETYLIGDDDFNWELGKYYDMKLFKYAYQKSDRWYIESYIMMVEETL